MDMSLLHDGRATTSFISCFFLCVPLPVVFIGSAKQNDWLTFHARAAPDQSDLSCFSFSEHSEGEGERQRGTELLAAWQRVGRLVGSYKCCSWLRWRSVSVSLVARFFCFVRRDAKEKKNQKIIQQNILKYSTLHTECTRSARGAVPRASAGIRAAAGWGG